METKRFSLKLSESDYKFIEGLSNLTGQSMSKIVRKAVGLYKESIRTSDDVYAELSTVCSSCGSAILPGSHCGVCFIKDS